MAYRGRKRRNKGNIGFLVIVGTMAIIVLALIIALNNRGTKTDPQQNIVMNATPPVVQATELPPPEPLPTEAPAQTEEAIPAQAEVLAQPTATPVPAPAVMLTPAPALSTGYAAVMPTATAEGFMPVFKKAEGVTEKVVCITVDDCFQFTNTRKIIDLALSVNGKLTFFPIATNALKDGLQDIIRYAHEVGMEIENHTYSHDGLYGDTDEELVSHIYMADTAMDHILGVNYRQHFLRPRGGDDRNDQRTQQYIRQLGYYGIAHWTTSGSSTAVSTLLKNVQPGNIYLFHTTNNDLTKLQEFIPALTEMGYKLVTLNEMFGLPENEVQPETRTEEEMKTPIPLAPYDVVLVNLSKGAYNYSVKVLQERLMELGYLDGKADGVYGGGTYDAVGYFQQAAGIKPTGKADVETQKVLYSENAPKKR